MEFSGAGARVPRSDHIAHDTSPSSQPPSEPAPASVVNLVDHIFECIAALRETVSRPDVALSADDLSLGRQVVDTLSADVSKLFRSATCGSYRPPPVCCPAHGELEVIAVGSSRHNEVLEHDLRGGGAGISCRYCLRESVLYDVKFNFCPRCKYVRCMFCVPRGVIHWHTLKALLLANPSSAGHVFPGTRLLLHELAALVPAEGCSGERDALEVIRLLLHIHPKGVQAADGAGDLPIHWACCGSSVVCLQLLMSAYPEGVALPNNKGQIPLHIACRGDNTRIVKQLLANTPAPHGLDRFGACGNLPLHIAAARQHVVSDIVLQCLRGYPDGVRLANKKTKQLPLHLSLSNRDQPHMKVVTAMLRAYPASALLPIGQEEELPLHLVLARPNPSVPAIHALLDISPECALTASRETAWSAAESPLDYANRKAAECIVAAADMEGEEVGGTVAGGVRRRQAQALMGAVRIMLSRNKKHDPSLLHNLNWEERKQGAYLLHAETENIVSKLSSAAGLDVAKRVISFI